MLKVLVVDDDETLRLTVRLALESRKYQITEARDGQEAVDIFKAQGPFDAVLLDVNMPRLSGIEALAAIKELNPRTFCLVMTAYSDVQDAITAIRHGAYDYLEKPVEAERILRMIDQALEAQNLVEIASQSSPQIQFEDGRTIIGSSSTIRKVFEIIYKLSRVDTSVLIRGESGTGKELVAQALHYNSHRKKGPFVAVNCAAIPENLIESELFGHEKGSFTGADRKKIGKFQYAAGGTIFLDEIGDITPQMQVKLLRVLQEKRFTPVGGNQEVECDVRVIAATNRPLEDMMTKDTFRPDLFYRLNVLPIHLPPLRDRKDDISSLITFMIKKFNKVHSRNISTVTEDALRLLKEYSWPGNIRELENVIEHAFILEGSDRISAAALPAHINIPRSAVASVEPSTEVTSNSVSPTFAEGSIRQGAAPDVGSLGSISSSDDDLNFPLLKEKFERDFIIRALRAYKGRINQTAEQTQMTKVTLLRKLEKYGINPRDFK